MIVSATSDLHGILVPVDKCELLLICGDISPLEIQRDITRMQIWLKSEFANWINNLPCSQVVMVAGNHDFVFKDMWKDEDKIKYYLEEPTKNKVKLLENSECNIISEDGNVYKIWGTPFCKQFGRWAFMEEPDKLIEAYKTMPYNCDIVISHDPPQIGKVGYTLNGTDAGNSYLAKEIKEKHPRYVFSGHIHDGCHDLKTYRGYGKTQICNVSLLNDYYHETYPIKNIVI
jgi:Icc-related predicted phosphoesterase